MDQLNSLATADMIWMLLCSFLVFLMQAGFGCLEAGYTRSKNTVNIITKNLVDCCLSTVCFVLIGFAIMYGGEHAGPIAIMGLAHHQFAPALEVFFLFQAFFCSTATTIVSGSIAERFKFGSYLVLSVFVSALIYPVFGRFTWASDGFLRQTGYIDFAGASVVHVVGGAIALVAAYAVGPRLGRFGKDGSVSEIVGSNYVFVGIGTMLLWGGWIGFNGGSNLHFDREVPKIILNTILAGAMGGLLPFLAAGLRSGVWRPYPLVSGVLAGLVAITASCHLVAPIGAMQIGAIGGFVALAATTLLERFRIDDVVGAVPVHLAAGAWGVIAVAIFGDASRFPSAGGRIDQLAIQLLGLVVCIGWTLSSSGLVIYVLKKTIGLRVADYDEKAGLNMSEHGQTSEIYALVRELAPGQARTENDR